MSSIRFESLWKKEKERDAIRSARQAVLASAEAKGLREAERRQKEDSWMLPNLDKSLDDSNEKKSRKRKKKDKKSKKHKKEKKSKKKKRKERSSSSSSSSESEEDEWVEKTSEKKSPVRQQRESWMDFGLMAQTSAMSRNTELSTKKSQKTIDREIKEEEHRKESLKRELNPNIRKEHNLPVGRSSTREEEGKSDPPQRRPSPLGNSWIERAYQRIKEQAEREGKSVEEVAKERWGSLDKFKSLLGKIEEDKAKVLDTKEDGLRKESKSRTTGWKTVARKEEDKVKSYSMMRSKSPPERERSPPSSRDIQDSKVNENDKEPNKASENEPKVMMSEKEMNALGAKIVKAGIFNMSNNLSVIIIFLILNFCETVMFVFLRIDGEPRQGQTIEKKT